MKKLVIVAFLLLGLTAVQAQKFDGFFKPVSKEIVASDRAIQSQWLFRPAVTISAMMFVPSTEKGFEVQPLAAAGGGLSYQHFIDVKGEPYNNFGVSLLALFNTNGQAAMSVAGAVNAWQYLNVGFGYNFTQKNIFFLTGISYSFN